jgi:hypothetical protein
MKLAIEFTALVVCGAVQVHHAPAPRLLWLRSSSRSRFPHARLLVPPGDVHAAAGGGGGGGGRSVMQVPSARPVRAASKALGVDHLHEADVRDDGD